MKWEHIATAPSDRHLQLAVVDKDDIHALAFACRRVGNRWINCKTNQQIVVSPTHWREWDAKFSQVSAPPHSYAPPYVHQSEEGRHE